MEIPVQANIGTAHGGAQVLSVANRKIGQKPVSRVLALFAPFRSALRPTLLGIIPFLAASSLLAQTTCGNVQSKLTSDYSFAIGSSSGGSPYTY